MSIFGFSTEPSSGGDFLSIVKYDARAGLWFRVDRIDTGSGFVSEPVDITRSFKALFDLENLETGWINFQAGGAPAFALIPMNDLLAGKRVFPDQPGDTYKHGVRFLIKLAKNVGGEKPVREVAGTSKAFLSGIEALYQEYRKGAQANPGKLPVVVQDGIALIKTGSGNKVSSNYRPNLSIQSWGPRGDLKFVPRSIPSGVHVDVAVALGAAANGQTPPSTGATRAPAPQPAQPAQPAGYDASDFG